jgi:hypothetical protein
MLRASRRFAVVFLGFGLPLISGKFAHSQDQSSTFPKSMANSTEITRPCRDRRPIPDAQRERGSVREAEHADKLCTELAFDRNASALPWHADVREKENEDRVLEELNAMGAPGLIIMRAREEVIEILEGHNRCAAWFAQAEPDAVRKFRSLRYAIDESDPQYTLKIQNAEGRWLYQQPYVASSVEDATAGSTIAINGKGAFFQLRAGVRIVPRDGGPGGLSTSQLLHVDFYVGGTIGAQVTALLHEFAHVVGMLPPDGGSFSGRELSTQNTQIVLRNCRRQVETAEKHKSLFLNVPQPEVPKHPALWPLSYGAGDGNRCSEASWRSSGWKSHRWKRSGANFIAAAE